MSLEQIQKEGEELFDKQFLFAVKYKAGENEIVDFDYHSKERENLKSFNKDRTTLAYQAGEKAMLEKVLREIDKLEYKSEEKFGFDPLRDSPIFSSERKINQTLTSLKEKLSIKE